MSHAQLRRYVLSGPGRAGRPGDDGSLLSAIAASILGGGGGLGFGVAPLTLLDPLGGGARLGVDVPLWGGGGARGRRAPAAPPPPSHDFRVELVPEHGRHPGCAACHHPISDRVRIGLRPQGAQGRRGAAQWQWHHLQCLSAAHWREARVSGVANLRGIPPPEQSLVRQHLSLAPTGAL